MLQILQMISFLPTTTATTLLLSISLLLTMVNSLLMGWCLISQLHHQKPEIALLMWEKMHQDKLSLWLYHMRVQVETTLAVLIWRTQKLFQMVQMSLTVLFKCHRMECLSA
uniref:Uncharacterized protein n=1 Tax=Opuntia streptacantha TaxID=393608 RepID=A0A7C9AQB6_OPUST